ncbi:hypothetical protein [Clostridium sp. DL1XJH146]
MKKKIFLLSLIFILVTLTLTGCVPGDGRCTSDNPAGFIWGIWHGWVAPISVVLGFFSRDIRIYEVANTGWWYDFGFYIAIISGFGSVSLARKHKSKKDD